MLLGQPALFDFRLDFLPHSERRLLFRLRPPNLLPVDLAVAPASRLGKPPQCAERHHFLADGFRLDLPAADAGLFAPLDHVVLQLGDADGINGRAALQDVLEVVQVDALGQQRVLRLGSLGNRREIVVDYILQGVDFFDLGLYRDLAARDDPRAHVVHVGRDRQPAGVEMAQQFLHAGKRLVCGFPHFGVQGAEVLLATEPESNPPSPRPVLLQGGHITTVSRD